MQCDCDDCVKEREAFEIAVNSLENENTVIRLMAEFINTFDIDERICKGKHDEIRSCEEDGYVCVDCIMEHFGYHKKPKTLREKVIEQNKRTGYDKMTTEERKAISQELIYRLGCV